MESRRLVIALVAALGVCLLIIGIFIGRESARPDATPPPIAQPAPQKPLPPIFEPPATPPAATATAPTAPSAPSVDPEEKRRVAQYFRDVDRLQNVDVDDPQASAQALIDSAGSGDNSGLQKLVAQARAAEQQARALTPPAPCAAYHKKLVALLAESREMIQKLAAGFAGGSLDALPSLMTRANSEKARQESLARDEAALKRRYGL
jgi:pyruvate/2-oxoglutarate dehydrogenase complex dihydrolipoamide acyltransferase (E2) component